ncbi:adenylate/guanylate cyclase domain-containing protein [Radicibacter daui]|uniref:adenylate/guanylate cyclase domain-containing protein n=1 Tax=Radicibacter daui TaxID=3064829 RepID=UPI004046E22C
MSLQTSFLTDPATLRAISERQPNIMVDALTEWLVDQSLSTPALDQVVAGTCERLYAAGVPISRVMLGYRTLHPMLRARSFVWERGKEIESFDHRHFADGEDSRLDKPLDKPGDNKSTDDRAVWARSPMSYILEHKVPMLRRRLTGPEKMLDFLVLEELAEDGHTDYLAIATELGRPLPGHPGPMLEHGVICSWTTDAPEGFTKAHLADIMRVQRRMAVTLNVGIKWEMANNLATTYLGPDAGQRVLAGKIRRGDGESISAVIWFSDLRNSTGLAESMPPENFLRLLNRYFECTAGAVLAEGGEVLRFIGDAVLAIFPQVSAEEGARRARRAMQEALRRLEEWNQRRLEHGKLPIGIGIGLHCGEVMFGNIGVPERLEFSVIGHAANTASRLESLTKELGEPVIVSANFAALLPNEHWRFLGDHALRGTSGAVGLFAPVVRN